MSSIGQGPVQGNSLNRTSGAEVDYSDDSVKQGYSQKNSYSRTEGEQTVKSQAPKPKLDQPGPNAESQAVEEQVLADFEKSQKNAEANQSTPSPLDGLNKALEKRLNNPFGVEKANLEEARASLVQQGFSEEQIDALIKLVSTKGGPSGFPAIFSHSAKIDDVINGGEKLDKLFNAYRDVITKYPAISSIPPDLKAEIDAKLNTFTQKALSASPTLDVDSATTMLMEIQTKLQDNRIKFDQETIKVKQVEYDLAHTRNISKIRDSIEKAQKAQESGLIGKIFGWIAVAVMAIVVAVVAVVGAVFTGGALTVVAVSLMIASLAIVVTMMASQEAGSTWMMDIFGDSKEGKIGAMVFWTALIIALSIGGAVAGGFAGGAAGGAGAAGASAASSGGNAAASAGATATATAANATATATSAASKLANGLSNLTRILQLVNGAAMVGDGAASIANSSYQYQADTLRADAHENKAFMLRIQQAIEDATESLASAIEELQQGYSTAASIIQANHDTKTTLSRNLRA